MVTLGVAFGMTLFGLLLLSLTFTMNSFLRITRRPDRVIDSVKKAR